MSPPSNHDQSISVTFESIRDFNVKMIDMAHANMEAFFGLLASSQQRRHRPTFWSCGRRTPESNSRH